MTTLVRSRETNREAENRGLVAAEKKARLGHSQWVLMSTRLPALRGLCYCKWICAGFVSAPRTEQHCALMRGVSGNVSHTHSKPEKPSFLAQQCSRGQPSMQQHMTINTIYTYMEKPLRNYSWSWQRFHFLGGLIKETSSCSSSLASIKFVEERSSI